MRTPSFLINGKPLITCMVQAENPDDAINTIRNAAFDGCDAYGFQCEVLRHEFRTEENLQRIFTAMGTKPSYVTNYRCGLNHGKCDEELVEGLLLMQHCGATLLDVMGDLYCPDPLQITHDTKAVNRQMQLIDTIHAAGGTVLMSTHTFHFMPAEEVIAIAKDQEQRGADICKIVTGAKTEAEELENLRITELLRQELHTPFLYLSEGPYCKLLRMIGPMLGSCMWLTVQQHDKYSTKEQPVCHAVRQVVDCFDYNY